MQSTTLHNPDTEDENSTSDESTFKYDAGGHLQWVGIKDANPRHVWFVADGYGQVLSREEKEDPPAGTLAGPHARHYYFNGMAVGDVGNNDTSNVDYATSIARHTALQATGGDAGAFAYGKVGSTLYSGAATGTAYADFDQSYDAINGLTYQNAPSRYTVRAGDTLTSVAYALWGDASLWFTIADANGLFGSETLIAGTELIIPNKVHNFHNNADTYRVYDPNDAIGDNSPSAPRPKFNADGGCGMLGQALMMVVAIAVTVLIQAPVATLFAKVIGSSTLATAAAAATTAAVANAASQGVGLAMGVQSRFDWGALGTTALSAGVTAGLSTGFGATGASVFDRLGIGGSGFFDQFAQGAISNAMSQGIGIATGLQRKFDWTGVAAAGVTSGVSGYVGAELGYRANVRSVNNSFKAGVAGIASAIAGAATRSLMAGTDFGDNLIAVLPSAVASTIGNAIESAINDPLAPYRDLPASEIRDRLIEEDAARSPDADAFRALVMRDQNLSRSYSGRAAIINSMLLYPDLADDPEALVRQPIRLGDLSYSDPERGEYVVNGTPNIGTVVIDVMTDAQRGVNYADEQTWGLASYAVYGLRGGPVGALVSWGIGKGVSEFIKATGADEHIGNAMQWVGAQEMHFLEGASFEEEMREAANPTSAKGGEDPILMAQATETILGVPISQVARGGLREFSRKGHIDHTLVARIRAKMSFYPKVIDPRTDLPIPFPTGITRIVPRADRVDFGPREKDLFREEWERRGYPTPRGGWEEYDIHHITPRRFGGTNDFWNLVPVDRRVHQQELNPFWDQFAR